MKELVLNETPVRTSVNYGINNIKINLEKPEFKEFKNFKIDVRLLTNNEAENEKNMSYRNSIGKNSIEKNLSGENSIGKKMNKEELVDKNLTSKIEIQQMQLQNEKIDSRLGLGFENYYKTTIKVKANETVKEPIELEAFFDEENNVFINQIDIVMEENSQANFIIKAISLCEKDNVFNKIKKEKLELTKDELENNKEAAEIKNGKDKYKKNNLDIFFYLKQTTHLKKNAKANITIASETNFYSNYFVAVENKLDENAELTNNMLDLYGKNKITNIYTKLVGDNSKNYIKNIYLGAYDDIIDINYDVETIGKNTEVNIESQGAISGNARKHFKGIIDFKEGSSKAIGRENENCILLSSNAISKSLPVLLCHEEDVFGEHGVSSGKIDEDKLFYLMSRGLSEIEAKKLIVRGNFNNIVSQLVSEKLKNEVNQAVENLLG